MNRKTSAAITTACVGVAVGTAAYMLSGNTMNSKNMKKTTKKWKKNTGKALHNVSAFIDDMSYMMH